MRLTSRFRLRIEQLFHPKILHPILFAQSRAAISLTCIRPRSPARAQLVRIEPALPPDDRLDQHRIEVVCCRDHVDELIVLLKPRRTDPFVKRVKRIARAQGEESDSGPGRQEEADDEFKKKADHRFVRRKTATTLDRRWISSPPRGKSRSESIHARSA